MLNKSLAAFEEFREKQFSSAGGISEYEAEIGKVLSQLQWLLARAVVLQQKTISSMQGDLTNLDGQSLNELEIVTEAFYYFAGRLTEIFKMSASFNKVPLSDAEMIRHRLLQHPEKQKHLVKAHPEFSVGSPVSGPKIKSYIGHADSQVDNGLYVNAREFDTKVAATIRAYRV